jgi:hypothetical protein
MSRRWTVIALLGVAVAGIVVAAVSRYVFINTKASIVDPGSYLGQRSNAADIYGRPGGGKFYSPLNANLAPMDKLLLVSFEGDPQYEAIELQTFDDRRGRAARVLMYHHQGPADYYYSDAAFIDPSETNRNLIVPDMQYAFTVKASGLDAALRFRDKDGKSIEFTLKETSHARWAGGFLAPVGGSTAIVFDHFPFYHMKRMNFMPRRGAAPVVRIGGELRTPATLPVPVDWEMVYLARYTDAPIIGQWNRPYDGELPALQPTQQATCQDGQPSYALVDNHGHSELRRMISCGGRHTISFEFSPPIPDLPALKTGADVSGRFAAGADDVPGIVAGTYHVVRRPQAVEMEILPLEGWQPFPGTIWVRTWAWKGLITTNADGRVHLKSGWTRIAPAH